MPCSSPINQSRLPPAESLRNLACTTPGRLLLPAEFLSGAEAGIKFALDRVATIFKP